MRIDQTVRDPVVPTLPTGWVGLDQAATILGVAQQTVLHKVQRGELQAVQVNGGQRKA
jgi:excisionase family DNA binding protein